MSVAFFGRSSERAVLSSGNPPATAKARGKPLTDEESNYLIDRALAIGAIDSNGDLNFHMRGTRVEIIDGMMATAKAWGSPISRAKAARITDKEIRRRRLQIRAAVSITICFALWIVIAM
jgi:hypothetical protein